ncbi:protein-glutamate methylesterase/protein-glutamine glutaminase [Thalassolituus sp. UBA2009]|uniref:protein-glutamate methylesterase/protein-glutamine glutaminase n=1 Tax=Thalassolituus sp. UBA2009 TaxID=1947658 RepID=UPI00257DDB8A|nr:chemotaxis response regulator protein-glutamate methylesterase [Thalassolituus sp. UBA2009]
MERKIRVLVVDDSAVVRNMMTDILSAQPDIEVTGAAADPYFAIDKMRGNWPDVITLDVEMPRMDGLTFLRKIMKSRPTPVVICSSLTEKGAETTLEALSAGAVAIFTKPKLGVKDFLQSSAPELVDAVRAAARSRVKTINVQNTQHKLLLPERSAMIKTTETVVAIGTSTGGTLALEKILTTLPVTAPGIVIVQHMPEKFTAAFAKRLDSICAIEVREAVDGDRVRPGLALVAPGGKHMTLTRSGAFYYVAVKSGPAVNRHCPSVDVLFRSAAHCAGKNAVGIILTGMGDDGARGLQEMLESGAETFGQDEASCVVYGMPKEAVKRGAVQHVIGLGDVAGVIMRYV